MTSNLDRAITNWLALEIYYANSASASIAVKAAQATVLIAG